MRLSGRLSRRRGATDAGAVAARLSGRSSRRDSSAGSAGEAGYGTHDVSLTYLRNVVVAFLLRAYSEPPYADEDEVVGMLTVLRGVFMFTPSDCAKVDAALEAHFTPSVQGAISAASNFAAREISKAKTFLSPPSMLAAPSLLSPGQGLLRFGGAAPTPAAGGAAPKAMMPTATAALSRMSLFSSSTKELFTPSPRASTSSAAASLPSVGLSTVQRATLSCMRPATDEFDLQEEAHTPSERRPLNAADAGDGSTRRESTAGDDDSELSPD